MFSLFYSNDRLKNQFSRLQYTRSSYTQPPTHALTKLAIPLHNGARNPYYTDIIGNVSTSRFRPARGATDAHLEITPRYPVYGGWNYTFRIGWNVDLVKAEKIFNGERILQVPFMEGPDNIQYEKFDINVILPEGSRYEYIVYSKLTL
jgi:oligosaccharyltransferase complex subunit alpha (ribophorin I)